MSTEQNYTIPMSTEQNYTIPIYKTFEHIQKGFKEIVWERLLYDPLQDYYIEKGLEEAVRILHRTDKITSGYGAIHELLHRIPLPFGLTAHTPGIKLIEGVIGFNIYPLGIIFKKSIPISTPGVEVLLHLGFNAILTVGFIWRNVFYVGSIPSEMKYIVTELSKFFGVNPLEIMHSAKSMLGEGSSIGQYIEYLSYGENYNKYRANDEGYKQTMSSYNNFMEFGDALMHAVVELSLIGRNQHLSEMPILHMYLQARLYLYENTDAEEKANNEKIEILKSSNNNKAYTDNSHHHSLPEESSTWKNWLKGCIYNENKGYIYNTVKIAHGLYTLYKTLAPIVKILHPYTRTFMRDDRDVQHGLCYLENQRSLNLQDEMTKAVIRALKQNLETDTSERNNLIKPIIEGVEQLSTEGGIPEASISCKGPGSEAFVTPTQNFCLGCSKVKIFTQAIPTPPSTPGGRTSRGTTASPVLEVVNLGKENSFVPISNFNGLGNEESFIDENALNEKYVIKKELYYRPCATFACLRDHNSMDEGSDLMEWASQTLLGEADNSNCN